jgi:hypothetical protein
LETSIGGEDSVDFGDFEASAEGGADGAALTTLDNNDTAELVDDGLGGEDSVEFNIEYR